MTRPQDIPQDVWEMALRFWRDSGCANRDAVPFARAIMAAKAEEREACAQVVFDTPEAVNHPMGPAYNTGWAAAVQVLRIRIRKRGEA